MPQLGILHRERPEELEIPALKRVGQGV
jgi:hypothetical protein